MAFEAFLRVEGLSGPSSAPGHGGDIDLISFFDDSVPEFGRSGDRPRKPFSKEVSFVKAIDATSATFALRCANGQPFRWATLFVEKVGGDENELYMKLEMQNVLVNTYNISGPNDKVESITIQFSKPTRTFFLKNSP